MALPSGYSQLRYIQSSGTQYIDTAFFPSGNALRVVMKFQYTAAHSSMSLFGNHTSTPYSLTVYGARPTFWVGETNDLSCGPETELNTDYTLDAKVDGGTLTAVWNGTTYTAAYSGSLYTEQSVFIFGGNSNGALAEAGSGYRLYSFKLYDDGMLKRDFVPAKNSSGTIGLYDLANNTFYGNAGTGSFTAGPLVTGPVDGVGVCIINAASFAINAGKCILNGAVKEITEGMTLTAGTAKKIALKSGIDVAAMAISYTGAYTDQLDVVMSGKTYRLLTLTGSGTLTVPEEVTADVWMCNGGNGGGGGGGSAVRPGKGGGGGYVLSVQEVIFGTIVCTVGSGGNGGTANSTNLMSGGAGGTTSFDTSKPTLQSAGANGASGGGGHYISGSNGNGAGVITLPFGDTDTSHIWAKYHSAGGGGGGFRDAEIDENASGGSGGSNGGNGSIGGTGNDSSGGTGGNYGGGSGGKGSSYVGSAAKWYGSGGGGGGAGYNSKGTIRGGDGGSGYQGVIYVRIPYEQ